MIPKLNSNSTVFPSPASANEDGVVAWGGDLAPKRLYSAYRSGIFPWYGEDSPLLWWSPDPRFVLEFSDFRLTKSLKKSLKRFSFGFDEFFDLVIQECANSPRKQEGTWLNAAMQKGYKELHRLGLAHSVECYSEGELVGGLYGVVVGGVFCGESMFSKKSDASKAALYVLVQHLQHWGYSFLDAQVYSGHLERLGAKQIPREQFLKKLQTALKVAPEHRWSYESECVRIKANS